MPILDEHKEKDRCIARLKNAFALGLHGDAAEVLDGSAEGMLREKHEESGAMVIKSEKEKAEEKGARKREREGDSSLDGYIKRSKKDEKEGKEVPTEGKGKKAVVQGQK